MNGLRNMAVLAALAREFHFVLLFRIAYHEPCFVQTITRRYCGRLWR